jgi:hypothetical protein
MRSSPEGDVIPHALQNATRTIPIVVITEDMVAAGFAASRFTAGAAPLKTIRGSLL